MWVHFRRQKLLYKIMRLYTYITYSAEKTAPIYEQNVESQVVLKQKR